MKKYNLFISFFVLYIIINMVLLPKVYINATFEGIKAWAFNVLPSVLPFIFFTKALSSLGFTEKCSKIFSAPCKKLWNCPPSSSVAFLTSIISGYPVGAAMTAQLYQSGQINRSQALRMCSFCSTSGPMFIVGAVGSSMLGNATLGYIILFSHIVGAAINGLLYRKCTLPEIDKPALKASHQNANLSTLVQESTLNILYVGTIIAIFFVVITSLSPIFNLLPLPMSTIAEGVVEITKGCHSIAQNFTPLAATLAASFVISFGGFSSILQSFALLSTIGIPIKWFVLQKLSHAVISTLVSLPLSLILI